MIDRCPPPSVPLPFRVVYLPPTIFLRPRLLALPLACTIPFRGAQCKPSQPRAVKLVKLESSRGGIGFAGLRNTDSISTTSMSNSKDQGFPANAGAFLSNSSIGLTVRQMPSANESRGDDCLDEAFEPANEYESVIDTKDREAIQDSIT